MDLDNRSNCACNTHVVPWADDMRLKRVLLCSLLIVATPAKGANLTVRPSRQSAAKAVLDAARQKEPFPGVTWRPPGQVQASSGRPLCGLQDVTLVLMTPHAERIPSLLGYADWFGSVLFFLQDDAVVRPPAKGALAKPVVVLNQCALCRSAIANVSARRNVACDCHTGWAQAAEAFRQHAKYMPALQRAAQMRHPHRMKGVMFSHFDMLLNVRLLEHVPSFRVPWVLESGYKGTQAAVAGQGPGEVPYQPACFRPDEKKWGKWNWFNNSRSKCSAAWSQLVRMEVGVRPACCYGWADLFYVPASHLEELVQLAGGPFSTVHMEVAIPTAMRIVATRHNLTTIVLHCFGGAVVRGAEREMSRGGANLKHLCAHRIDLSKLQGRQVVMRATENPPSGCSTDLPL